MNTERWWIIVSLGVLWVGGWGLLFYRKPDVFVRAGMRRVTPGRIKFVQKLGILEMTLAALSLLNAFLMAAFHWKY